MCVIAYTDGGQFYIDQIVKFIKSFINCNNKFNFKQNNERLVTSL